MKVLTILAAFIFAIFLVSSTPKITADVSAQDGKKPPEVITLGADAKLGQIKFNHLDHITKNRSVDGTSADRLRRMPPHGATGSRSAQAPAAQDRVAGGSHDHFDGGAA